MKRWVLLPAFAFFALTALWMYSMIERVGIDSISARDLSVESLEQIEKLVEANRKTLDNLVEEKHSLEKMIVLQFPKYKTKTSESQTRKNVSTNDFHSAPLVHMEAPLPAMPMCQHTVTAPRKADVQLVDVFNLLPFDNPDGGVWKQGFEISYTMSDFEKERLHVFVVPHSHNDPGWLQTFESYYNARTRNILTNIVNALTGHPNRKFIWAEISYLSLWWDEQGQEMRNKMLALIRNGQLEIVTGGWVMNDEANTHYFAMLDQLIEGHEWIKYNLGDGIHPHDGWAIDPFGHSPTMAYLLKRIGFDFMLIQRTHYTLKKYFAQNKILEFLWRQNWDVLGSTDMLSHMMPFYSYDVPHTCGPDPKICCQFDFRRLPGLRVVCPWRINPQPITDGNVQERAETLLDQYRKKAQLFRTNVLLVPLGDDFRYDLVQEVQNQYNNYEALMQYINNKPEMKAKVEFGTLNDYYHAVLKSAGDNGHGQPKGFSSVMGDFYTYTDRDDHYWSGYYSSRPFYKNLDRVLESKQRSAEILFSLVRALVKDEKAQNSFNIGKNFEKLMKSRRSLGIFQHHDGITGTAREAVVQDYGQKLITSFWDMQHLTNEAAVFLITAAMPDVVLTLKAQSDHAYHDSIPEIKPILLTQGSPRLLVVYNPLARSRTAVVHFRVDKAAVEVFNSEGKSLEIQVNRVWVSDDAVSSTFFEVLVVAGVPALGIASFLVREGKSVSGGSLTEVFNGRTQHYDSEPTVIAQPRGTFTMENAKYRLHFNDQGMMQSLVLKQGSSTDEENVHFDVKIAFYVYHARLTQKDKPGAYLFFPAGPAEPHAPGTVPIIRLVRGNLCQEVTVFWSHVRHTVRLYNVESLQSYGVEIENVANIATLDQTEFAMRLDTSVKNDDHVYYTDLNGFQMQRRQYLSKLPLQGNFYPMPSMAFFEDAKFRLSLVSAQPLGCASLSPGSFEVVLDRRLLQDDNRGLGQPIKDNKVTPSYFNLIVEKKLDTTLDTKATAVYPSLLTHLLSEDLTHPLSISFSTNTWSRSTAPAPINPLLDAFPCNVFLLNLRSSHGSATTVGPQTAMILHNKGIDCRFSIPASCQQPSSEISLGLLFRELSVEKAVNYSLTLMHDLGAVDLTRPFVVPPMEIRSVHLVLK